MSIRNRKMFNPDGSMASDLFLHELTNSGSVMGRNGKLKLQATMGEIGACTDGETVMLPRINAGSMVPAKDQAYLRGFLDHEAGHVKHTNFNEIERLNKRHDANPLTKSLVNALEDVRLERRVLDDYPMAASNLQATCELVNTSIKAAIAGEIAAGNPDPLTNIKQIGPVAVTWAGRKSYGGAQGREMLEKLDPKILAAVSEAADYSTRCTSTADIGRLAETMAAAWGEVIQPPPPGTPEPFEGMGETGKGEHRGEGEAKGKAARGKEGKGEGKGEGEGEGKGKGAAPSTEKSDDDEWAPGGGNPLGEVKASSSWKETPSQKPLDGFDVADVVMKETSKSKFSGGKGYFIAIPEFDMDHHASLVNVPQPEDTKDLQYSGHLSERKKRRSIDALMARGTAADYEAYKAHGAAHINVMRARLTRALMAERKRAWKGGQEEGVLDARRLVAAAGGSDTVFKKRKSRKAVNTAVEIVVDLSGSMCNDGKAEVARDCTIALAEVLDSAGIAFQITGFQNCGRISYLTPDGNKRLKSSHLGETCDTCYFKRWDETLFQAKGALSVLHRCAGGNNSDGVFIANATHRLLKRPEPRKVMLVLSDGCPAAWGPASDRSHHRDHAKKMVQQAEKLGIETVGIGICDGSVRSLYKNFVVVHDLKQLAGEAMGKLAGILLGQRNVIDTARLAP